MNEKIEGGYIFLSRQLPKSSLNTMRPEDFKLAINLLVEANWIDQKIYHRELQRDVVIKRGELLTNMKMLAEISKLSYKNVRTSLKNLTARPLSEQDEPFLTKGPFSGNRNFHVIINKYRFYNNPDAYTGNTPATHRQQHNIK